MKEIYVPNFCLPFYTSLKAMDFQSIPFLGSGVNQKHWLAKKTSWKKKIKRLQFQNLFKYLGEGAYNFQQLLNSDLAAVAASFFWTPSPVWVWPPQHSTPFWDKHYLQTSQCSPFIPMISPIMEIIFKRKFVLHSYHKWHRCFMSEGNENKSLRGCIQNM